MKLEQVPLSRLKPWDKNPRINDAAAERLAKLIEAHGFINPIVATPDGIIRAGHTRYKAAQHLKLATVPVLFVDFASEAKASAYALADNKSSEWAEWDMEQVASVLDDIRRSDVQLFETGFSAEEIERLFHVEHEGIGSDPDDVPSLPDTPRTKRGDLYQLGRHRLVCGDATDHGDVERLMGTTIADIVFTDPPYNVDYEGKTKDALKIKNDAMGSEQFRDFLKESFSNMIAHTKAGGAIYVTHADMEGYNFRGAFTDAGWMLKQCLVWVKQTIVMGRQDYHWQHEPILYGWAPGAAHTWNTDRKQSTLLNFDRPTRSEEHPTMKPVALIEYLLGNSSFDEAAVMDLFGGSGSTMIACEMSKRRAFLLELDPAYCDVIIERWERFTGKKAERINA
jgi:site-specific DNA-methyltransferase (adenine-specific)